MERGPTMEDLVNMDFLNVYKNKRVFITGHTGFKGGWLSVWLNMLGADVFGYALDPMEDDGIFIASGIGNFINDTRADIRDRKKLNEIFSEFRPEIVFHLAAQALVLDSYENPLETFEINTQGTANVLEAIRQTTSVKAAVMITTDKCYENREWQWGYRENEAMGGHDPYSASKGAAELIIASYRRSFFDGKADIASARAGNVIGGGDWAKHRLVPDIFRSINDDHLIEIRNPNATRPWQYVLEPLGGYLLLGARLLEDSERYTGAWNFGPLMQDVYSVMQVVEKIIDVAKKGKSKDTSIPGQLHEANLLMLDISKAMHQLKWKPVLNFDDTIRLTTEWYMSYKQKDVLELTQNQIIHYQERWKLKNGN